MKDRFHRHYPAEGWPLYWLLFGYTSNRIILDRSSYDFGKPKWHLLDVLKVPSVYRGLRLVYYYDDGREYDVSQELPIEYYD